MIIRFEDMELSVFPAFKGGEKEFEANMFYDGTSRIFKGCLRPGASIGLHTHEDSCETIFVLRGNGVILEQEPDKELMKKSVRAGDCLYCPKGHTHSLCNTSEDENLQFYAVVAQQ